MSDASYYISNEKKKNKGSQMENTKNKISKKISNDLFRSKYEWIPCLIVAYLKLVLAKL